MRRALLIPMYNSALTVGGVLDSISDESIEAFETVIVLDNASTDDSVEQVLTIADERPSLGQRLALRQHSRNLGYGGSIKRGIVEAVHLGVDMICIIHSDDQTDWGNVVSGLLSASSTDLAAYGSRFSPGANIDDYSWKRVAGNKFFRIATTVLTRTPMADPGAAICIVPTGFLDASLIENLDNGFMFHPQLNLVLFNNPDFRSTTVPMRWKDASVDNNFPLARYGLSLLRFLISYWWFHTMLRRPPQQAVISAAGT